MDNYACINFDAQNCAKQTGLEPSGAALSPYSTHHASTAQQQQDAASTLKEFNNEEIFAWLKLARSTRDFEPIPEQRSGERHLSPSQVLALSALKDCPNDRLLGWLELARLYCHIPTSHALQRSYDSGSGSGIALPYLCAQPKLSAAEVTSSTNATALVPNPWITQVATDHFCGHSSSRSANSTRPNNADNHYWCTVCEDLKSFKDSGGWKKHEKEHETIFICGLGDTAENSTASQSHASNPYTCKRRDMMVNHLSKLHGISEAHHGRDLADQLQHTVEKQAWSCGFCIHLLLTFQDRLKHIDIEHFRRHQSILEWDWNKVILGLLQQPKMEKAWKMRTASLPPWVHLETLSWDKATAKELRATLEIGPSDEHHANTLANAAYSARIRNERSWPQSGTINAHRHSDATAHANFLASSNHYEATSALKCDSGLYPGLSPSITGSNTHLVSSDSSCFEAPKSSFSFGNTVEVAMPSLDDDGGVDHNALPFNPSQSWSSASQPGIFNGYELSGSYGGRSADCLTPNQYGQ